MVKSVLIWLLAFFITVTVAVYQRITGPTYPISGSVLIEGTEISYKFLRSEDVGTDLKVGITTADSTLSASTFWKRFKSNDDWTETRMMYDLSGYYCLLPSQPAAGKLEYFVSINNIKLPQEENIIVRFKGAVPLGILILHVIAMFGAMLLSTRTGLEFFNENPNLKTLTYWTLGFLIIGGFILGPIVQKYAFDAYWTGWPFGQDLTDNKTAVAIIGWLAALVMYKKSKYPKQWALFASILLLIVYLIPHSLLGSELDYSQMDIENKSINIESHDRE
jgi:hypothetical protein